MTDRLMQWLGGESPYEVLSDAGITPASSMKEILEAAAELIESGLWTPLKRAAWDELRTIERRLWVDFFRYPATIDEVVAAFTDLCGPEPAVPMPDVSHLLRLDLCDLQRMEDEFQKIEAGTIEIERIGDLDEPIEMLLRRVEFDM